MSSTKKKENELRNAARDGRIGDVKKYLNDDTVNVNGKDSSGWTALLCACFAGHDVIAELLLDHGADIDAVTNDNWTPLMMACSQGHLSTIKLLLARGASVNAANQNDNTALHKACCNRGSIKCAEELLDHGADTSIKNKDGKTPLNLAQDYKNQSIIDLLMEHKKRSELATIISSVQDTMNARNEEMNQTFEKLSSDLESKVETIIDRQCEEMKISQDKMKQSFEELTSQLTLSNAEVVKCVSNLSAIVGHLSLKVSAMEGHIDSKKDGHCEELVCDTIPSLQRVSRSHRTASNEYDVEKKKDGGDEEDFEKDSQSVLTSIQEELRESLAYCQTMLS